MKRRGRVITSDVSDDRHRDVIDYRQATQHATSTRLLARSMSRDFRRRLPVLLLGTWNSVSVSNVKNNRSVIMYLSYLVKSSVCVVAAIIAARVCGIHSSVNVATNIHRECNQTSLNQGHGGSTDNCASILTRVWRFINHLLTYLLAIQPTTEKTFLFEHLYSPQVVAES